MRVVNEDLLASFRQKKRCERCLRGTPSGADPHHLFARGAGRADIACNLMALCRICHDAFHLGKIKRAELLAIVGRREGMTAEQIESEVQRIRRTPKP